MTKVFVNGTFDIIHPGHVSLLNYAKELGDFLLVAIDTDERVRKLKGLNRPINNQASRSFVLQNLKAVDEVVLFNDDKELLSFITQCDIMVKGSDYIGQNIIGFNLIKTVFYDRTEHSTTKIIEHIIDR
jgi:D-beta-D-heptose 7-phosphate kinase/D-beta-D-heptose 1-phosphate adenosyltransferase